MTTTHFARLVAPTSPAFRVPGCFTVAWAAGSDICQHGHDMHDDANSVLLEPGQSGEVGKRN